MLTSKVLIGPGRNMTFVLSYEEVLERRDGVYSSRIPVTMVLVPVADII